MEEITSTLQRTLGDVMNIPSSAESILECDQGLHSTRHLNKKSLDCLSSAIGSSLSLFSEDDSEYDPPNPADRRENEVAVSYSDRSPVHHVTSEDSPSSPSSSWREIMEGHIFKPGSGFCSPPSSDIEEEIELAYTSQTVLLEISSSSSSTGIPVEYSFRENSEEQRVGCGACAETTSNSSTEWESSNSDSQSIEETKDPEKSSSKMFLPHHQVAKLQDFCESTSDEDYPLDNKATVEGFSFTYEYKTNSKEVIQAVRNLRYPVETNEWAVEYLSTTYPVKRKRIQ